MNKFLKISFLLLFAFLLLSNVELNRSLIVAISRGDFLKVKKLVESGANVNYVHSKGKSALHWAASSGNLKIVAYLIYKGAKVNVFNENGASPLQIAAIGKNLDVVKLLVQNGADIEHKDRNGWDAFHYFVYYDFGLGVKYLLTQGICYTNATKKKFMDIPAGYTPLDIAYKKNLTDIALILEDPTKFTSLSTRIILKHNITFVAGDDSFLSPLENGLLTLYITNIGGIEANNLKIELKPISNTEDIEFERYKLISLNPGETKEVPFTIKGLSNIIKSGKAFFEFFIYNDDFTNLIKLNIEKLYKPLPDLIIIAMFQYPFELKCGEKTNLIFRIENRGKGNLENASFSILFPNNKILLTSDLTISNFSVSPLSYTNISIEIFSLEDLTLEKPIKIKSTTLLSSIISITNSFYFEIKPLPLPFFTIGEGTTENPITNFSISKNGSYISTFYISNNTETAGEELILNLKVLSEKETNSFSFTIKKFPPYGTINFPVFMQPEEYTKTFDIEILYKTKKLFKKELNIFNISPP